MPECSRRHKCFAERVFPGGAVSNENENGSHGKYPTFSSVCKASMLRLHVYMHPHREALACFDMSQRLVCFRARLPACFVPLYFTFESHRKAMTDASWSHSFVPLPLSLVHLR